MSLGAGAFLVSGGPQQVAKRRYPWQPWKREPPKEPDSKCLENGGTRRQGDLVPPITQTNPQAPKTPAGAVKEKKKKKKRTCKAPRKS